MEEFARGQDQLNRSTGVQSTPSPTISLSVRELSPDNLQDAIRIGKEAFNYYGEYEALAMVYTQYAKGPEGRSYKDPFEEADITLKSYGVLYENNTPVAVGGLYRYDSAPEGEYCVGWLAVSPAFRGHGYAHQVMEWIESTARENAATKITVYTPDALPAYEGARKLYESRGYELQKGQEFEISVKTSPTESFPSMERIYVKEMKSEYSIPV